MAEQQQNPGSQNPFAQRAKAMAQANRARRSANHSLFNESGGSPDPENPFAYRQSFNKTANTGDVNLRNDSIVSALKEGNAPLTMGKSIIGYENNRVDLLIDQESRKLMDILPYTPSREESLANLIRRECRGMSEEEQFELACLDTKIDREAIRPMLMGSALKKQSVEQNVLQKQDAPEPPSKPVIGMSDAASRAAVGAARSQAVKLADDFPTSQQGFTWTGKDPATDQYSESVAPRQRTIQPLPVYPVQQIPMVQPATPTPAPLNLPFSSPPAPRVPLMPEKSVTLTCPIGRYKVPVLDVVQKPGYIVIIQREDASLLVAFEANHVTYRLDVVDADLEYSGITYEFNGAVHTVMVMK